MLSVSKNLIKAVIIAAVLLNTHTIVVAQTAPERRSDHTGIGIQYRRYIAAFRSQDWISIRRWYEQNLAADFVAHATNGRFLADRKTTLDSLPNNARPLGRVPKMFAVNLDIINQSVTGDNRVVLIVQETSSTKIEKSDSPSHDEAVAHVLKSVMLSRDTWQKRSNKWQETERDILKSETTQDGKSLEATKHKNRAEDIS